MRDFDGNHFIIGRVDNIINVSGHRIYLIELIGEIKELSLMLETRDLVDLAGLTLPQQLQQTHQDLPSHQQEP